MGDLRFRLRESTAVSHRELEAAMAIEARCERRDTYRDLLARMWGLYTPLEAALATIDWTPVNIDFPSRAKADWLAQDLAALGLAPTQVSGLPRASRLPRLEDLADGMGALYVLEGSSLGGQVISRLLRSRFAITEDTGGRFFASYGAEVGEKWRGYLAALENFGAPPPIAARIERAALDTFACFQAWLGEAPAATADARPGAG